MSSERKYNLSEFKKGSLLGSGRYCKVFLVKRYADQKEYAMKQINKSEVTRTRMFKYVLAEKAIMNQLDHPNIVKLYGTWSDKTEVYLLSQYGCGGELWKLLKDERMLRMDLVAFYAAELVSVLEYLQPKHILHRDIKPENIYLDENRHLILGDWGTAKILDDLAVDDEADYSSEYEMTSSDEDIDNEEDVPIPAPVSKPSSSESEEEIETTSKEPEVASTDEKKEHHHHKNENVAAAAADELLALQETEEDKQQQQVDRSDVMSPEAEAKARKRKRLSFAGTPEYMSPELLHNKNVSVACDLWALGVIIYQMIVGSWPFHADSPYLTFKMALKRKKTLKFPPNMNNDAKDLIEKLLHLNPHKRPGAHGFDELKNHPFFKDINWTVPLHEQEVPPVHIQNFFIEENREITKNMLSFLDTKELPKLARVCSLWNELLPEMFAQRGVV